MNYDWLRKTVVSQAIAQHGNEVHYSCDQRLFFPLSALRVSWPRQSRIIFLLQTKEITSGTQGKIKAATNDKYNKYTIA